MKHNQDIPALIRKENEDFNAAWISAQQLVGDAIIPSSELDVEESKKADASAFMVAWLKNIDRLFGLLPRSFDCEQATLIDVGCGSGISTIYIYKNYPCKSAIGIDFSANLIDIANINKQYLSSIGEQVTPLSFEVADASVFRVPAEKMILFLFNPFGWRTMKAFIENNIETLHRTNSVMLYANDICINELSDYAKIIARDEFFNLSIVDFGRHKCL